MNTLTLGSLRSPIARVLGISTTDSRVADVINEAQARLIQKGDWQGVFLRYTICTQEGCLVWPRQLETIEAMAVCRTPGVVRNEWFEFLGAGPGLQDDETAIGLQLLDRGTAPTFNQVQGTGKKVRLYAVGASDAGKKVILRYYDSNGQKVYSQISGTWQEGEEITLVAPPNYAITTYEVMPGGLYGVVKPVTNLPVALYEYDTVGLTNSQTLAWYEPQETNPIYRVSFLPGLQNYGGCGDTPATCAQTKVTVLARLRHIPVVVDADPLVLGCVAAFKLMAMAIKEEEAFHLNESAALEMKALGELEFELRAHLGQGPVVQARMADPCLFGGGGVDNLMSRW